MTNHDAHIDPAYAVLRTGNTDRRSRCRERIGARRHHQMNPQNSPPPGEANAETAALVEALHENAQRLEELTAGEVDTVTDRRGRTLLLRRAQDHLRRNEAVKQSAILNSLPARIALLDAQGCVISANEAWQHFAGAHVHEGAQPAIGVNYLNICDSSGGEDATQAQQVAAGIRTVLDGGVKRFSLEYSCYTPTEQRWFILHITPLAGSHPHGAVVMHLDITAEKQAEDLLHISELRFRQMAESTRDVFFLIDAESNRTLYVSPAYEDTWGRTCESLYAEPDSWIEAMHPDDQASAYQKHGKGTLTESFEDHYRIVRPDGSIRWIEARGFPVRDDTGKTVRIAGVAKDITERKRADSALRESDSRLTAVFHGSPISIMVSRVADGKILEANDEALRLYGYTRDELIGRTVIELGIYCDPDRRSELLAQLAERGQVQRFEVDFRNRLGLVGKLELSGRVIELQGEQCLVAMLVDITERKRLEEMHLQAQKLESLGTLAGGIAHDFNNILAAIRGNADLAAQDLGPDHLAAESLREIRKACERASELVRRIMTFGRPREKQDEAVDLGAVVDEVRKLLRSTLPAGISLTTNFAKDTPHVLADAGQIHEVIVNLTTNAAYAIGPRAGSIEYRLEPVQIEEDFVPAIAGLNIGRYARLTVTDSGCGMEPAIQARIFDVFYTTKPIGEGTGLGLSMVHGTMRSHGGCVTLESSPGNGSSFALYFPAAAVQAPAQLGDVPAPPVRAAGRRVLYVDDEEALIYLANRVLTRIGHHVSSFTDPVEALASFRAHPQDFDIVVTDLSMPRMSGLEFSREVLAVRPDIPVLMTTGYIRDEDEEDARAVGVRELILKPSTMNDLGNTLDRLFREVAAGE